jgi:hypothetical protein
VDGELVDVSGNTEGHNLLRDFLTSLLRTYVEEHQLGLIISEQDFDFGGNAHGPDVSFISQAKCHLINMKLRVQRFVRDLAIEEFRPEPIPGFAMRIEDLPPRY